MLSANPCSGGCWPTTEQELLLGAALHRDPEAAWACWTEWFARTNADDLDYGSFRLLPLMNHNLRRAGLTHPFFGRLQGAHRKHWVETRRLFHELRPSLARLTDAGIPVMLTKGAPLAITVYPDVGCRPMSDLDVLVPEARFGEALETLTGAGWKREGWMPAGLPREYFSFRHGVSLRSEAGRELDLHWHLLFWACSRSADAEFWAAAEPFDFYGLELLRPSPADALLQLCVHGLEWNEVPPLRWIADVVMLLRGPSPVDWERVYRLAVAYRLLVPLRAALRYVADRYEAPLPPEVLARLEQAPVTSRELREFKLYTSPFPKVPGGRYLLNLTWNRWRRASRHPDPLPPLALVRFLQFHYGFDSLTQLTTFVAGYPVRRLRRARRMQARG